MTPNKAAAPNRRPALRFGSAGFIGSWIRCQSPFPAAVGELVRWQGMHRILVIAFIWCAVGVRAYGLSSEVIVTPETLDQGLYKFALSCRRGHDTVSFHVSIAGKKGLIPFDSGAFVGIVQRSEFGWGVEREKSVAVTLKKESGIWQADFTFGVKLLNKPGLCFVFSENHGAIVDGVRLTDSATFYTFDLEKFADK